MPNEIISLIEWNVGRGNGKEDNLKRLIENSIAPEELIIKIIIDARDLTKFLTDNRF